MRADLVNHQNSRSDTFCTPAKMRPSSAGSRPFDPTCSAWLDRWVDTIPLERHGLRSEREGRDDHQSGGTEKARAPRDESSATSTAFESAPKQEDMKR